MPFNFKYKSTKKTNHINKSELSQTCHSPVESQCRPFWNSKRKKKKKDVLKGEMKESLQIKMQHNNYFFPPLSCFNKEGKLVIEMRIKLIAEPR